MREAGPDDAAALQAFLAGHEATSMFLIGNLMGRGVAMRVWRAGDAAVAGVVGRTADGMVLVQWPQGDWRAVRRALSGLGVSGLLGPADQVAGLRAALGLGEPRHAGDEPGLRLTLADLRRPEGARSGAAGPGAAGPGGAHPDLPHPGEGAGFDLRPVVPGVAATVQDWRAAYERELFALPAPEAAAKAARDVARWLVADSHRVLWHGAAPVALTGFNARLPEVVQVGAVYVPPALRGRGHARRAVGLHLAEARAQGVRRAVLFAASDAAERAYRALGFEPAGRMGIVLYPGARAVA